jgi:hypothetical protein
MRKKYPSQIRYEEKNPQICFRLKKDDKKSIEEMAKKAKKRSLSLFEWLF